MLSSGVCIKTGKEKKMRLLTLHSPWIINKAGRNKGMQMHSIWRGKFDCYSDNTWLQFHPIHFDEKVTLTSTIKNQRNRQIPRKTFCLILIYDICEIKAKTKTKKPQTLNTHLPLSHQLWRPPPTKTIPRILTETHQQSKPWELEDTVLAP